MSDFRDELAALVADTAAALEALRLQGTILVPLGKPLALGALPEVPRAPARPAPVGRAPSALLPAAPPGATAPTSPTPVAPPERPVAATPVATPSRVATIGEAPLMLGGWAALAEGPGERLARVVAGLGERCEGCGEAPLLGTGALRSGLVLVCDPLNAAGQGMLTNMLVKVVNVEPADVWTASPRPCGVCASGLAQQVQAIRPNAGLAMGADAAQLTGLVERGAWGKWAGISAVATWHPAEIEAGPAQRKRAAFDVLTEIARRR